MRDLIKQRPALTGIVLVAIVNLIMIVLGLPLMGIGNLDFLVGLFLLVLASIFIVGSGHLFTGWRFSFKKKSDLEAENAPKHPAAKDVASIKNQPIKVNKYARFCLRVGGFMLVLGIVLTSIAP
ncbi:DUF3899 domain-containing protein [Lentilactobacillus farraginis]|uniref:DUF3899 domain-containing protein n=1 Tax=Lentilactobacillus farraginis DSM 18382 = JCM 14108 TaxID=1423743 RepID=X0QCK9_9LACO|nr:DUF3899 domain-containing protein [Lentilactobacillus farraginis]KRM09601.1 hypothetical protein FD41_GL002487 [Lentilactobacillus farraginis DSM 18382 = JCM 14108]GAF36350.1 hypothetical protein JCM14108_1313 [Lentilactobacillus farraginis DSM 18382 = JCM 14108]